MLEKTVGARLCSLGTLANVENMNLWAVTLQVGAMYQILTVLWSVKLLWAKQWATCERSGWYQHEMRQKRNSGAGARKPLQCGGDMV